MSWRSVSASFVPAFSPQHSSSFSQSQSCCAHLIDMRHDTSVGDKESHIGYTIHRTLNARPCQCRSRQVTAQPRCCMMHASLPHSLLASALFKAHNSLSTIHSLPLHSNLQAIDIIHESNHSVQLKVAYFLHPFCCGYPKNISLMFPCRNAASRGRKRQRDSAWPC